MLQRRSTAQASVLACAVFVVLAFVALPSSFALAETPHVPATQDTDSCAACHLVHIDADNPTLVPGMGVIGQDVTVVCLPCHSSDSTLTSNVVTGTTDSFGLASGHSFTPTPTADGVQMMGCEACHDTHGSSADSPMIPAKSINGVAVTTSGPQVCLACHDKDDSWFGADYPSTSAPTRDASGYPISGTWPGPDAYESTSDAHFLIPETTQTASADGLVKRQQGDCLYCHAAHRGPNTYDGLLATFTVPAQSTLASDQADGSYATLCFDCHGGTTPSGFTTAPVDVKRFATATGGDGGHSIITSGGTLPVGAPLPCFECHNPHGSKRGNASLISDERGGSLETSSAAGVRQFCFTCHTTNDTIAGWDSDDSDYAAVSASDTVVGLPRDGGVLRLPANYGHNEGDPDSCYDCHGDDYAAGGNNVHDPSADGQATIAATTPSDTVPPVTVADLAGAYTGTISLLATDTGSGVAETLYSLDGGVLTTGTVVSATGDGTHTVQFWSVDNSSNVETPTIVAFLVDKSAPVTTSDAVAAYVDSATVTFTSQDNTDGVGVADTYWSLDGGDIATGTVVTTSTVGTHTVDFWAVDAVGNTEATQTISFTISSSVSMSGSSPLAMFDAGSGGTAAPLAADAASQEVTGWPDVTLGLGASAASG